MHFQTWFVIFVLGLTGFSRATGKEAQNQTPESQPFRVVIEYRYRAVGNPNAPVNEAPNNPGRKEENDGKSMSPKSSSIPRSRFEPTTHTLTVYPSFPVTNTLSTHDIQITEKINLRLSKQTPDKVYMDFTLTLETLGNEMTVNDPHRKTDFQIRPKSHNGVSSSGIFSLGKTQVVGGEKNANEELEFAIRVEKAEAFPIE